MFSRILSEIEPLCSGFRAAVFFDGEGETIDYHSYMDPYETRLLGAHYGVILASGCARSRWLGLGDVSLIQIYMWGHDSLILPLSEGFGLGLVVGKDVVDEEVMGSIIEVVDRLVAEAGI